MREGKVSKKKCGKDAGGIHSVKITLSDKTPIKTIERSRKGFKIGLSAEGDRLGKKLSGKKKTE